MMMGCECDKTHGEKRPIPHFLQLVEEPKKKKMKTEEELVLAYPPRMDGKKTKRLGKEEVERLLSYTVKKPTTFSDKEVMLQAMEAMTALAISKGYVDVEAEVTDDEDDMDDDDMLS
uniref:Uncharacterized protein n=1 Tax=Leersia perrieri TaxID=77586 RepID=A0A0D9VE06_9ORYZ